MSTLELKKKTPCLYTENRWQASSFALKVINEDCHVFRGQYDMANAIADETVKNIRNKVKNFQVHYEYEVFNTIDVTLEIVYTDVPCRGNIYRMNSDEGIIWITLTLSDWLIRQDDKTIKKEIMVPIVHELMHGNIFVNRMLSKVPDENVDETPEYYGILIDIMRTVDNESLIYYFARALYLYYYQEAQAMTSQVFGEIQNYFIETKTKKHNLDTFQLALLSTDVYSSISNSLWLCKKMKANEIQDYLWGEIEKYGINIPINERNKLLNKMINKFENTKKKVANSGFYHFIEEYGLEN